MKANTIGEYFGTLQQAVVIGWRKHLKTSKHNVHVILNDFYDDMLEAVDALVEGYMAHEGKVEGYDNLINQTKDMDPVEYIQALHDFAKENKGLLKGESELEGLLDDVLNVLDEALYKLKELINESKEMCSLSKFLIESCCKDREYRKLTPMQQTICDAVLDRLSVVDTSMKDWKKVSIAKAEKANSWHLYYDDKYITTANVDMDIEYDDLMGLNWMRHDD